MTSPPYDVNGVTSQIYVPSASSLSGLNYSASGADVYLNNGSFVQLGWVAHSDGTTWVWYGESLPSGGENLADLKQIGSGWHSFKIQRLESGSLTGYYQFLVDNSYVETSFYTHPWAPPGGRTP